jgi:hypothetical protein
VRATTRKNNCVRRGDQVVRVRRASLGDAGPRTAALYANWPVAHACKSGRRTCTTEGAIAVSLAAAECLRKRAQRERRAQREAMAGLGHGRGGEKEWPPGFRSTPRRGRLVTTAISPVRRPASNRGATMRRGGVSLRSQTISLGIQLSVCFWTRQV